MAVDIECLAPREEWRFHYLKSILQIYSNALSLAEPAVTWLNTGLFSPVFNPETADYMQIYIYTYMLKPLYISDW